MSETSASTDTSPTSEPRKIGIAWGDGISEERQRELDAILAAWDADTDHGARKSPFDASTSKSPGIKLTGADVFYLAACTIIGETVYREPVEHGPPMDISNLADAYDMLRAGRRLNLLLPLSGLHLEGASLSRAQLENAYLSGVHLERAYVNNANLANADLSGAHLDGLFAYGAHMERANLSGAQLNGAHLQGSDLGDAILYRAEMNSADLRKTRLERANLGKAELHGANLSYTQLQGADLGDAILGRANMRFARLDRDTRLSASKLTGVSIDQITFDNTNLTVVSWEGVAPLGDEKVTYWAKNGPDGANIFQRKDGRGALVEAYEAAVRSNRFLSTALRTQGLTEDADIFAYHAQIMQRKLRFQRRQFGRWLTSWRLAALSGYGYRLGRIFLSYAIVVLTFAALFLLPVFLAGGIPTVQNILDALQISLNAIHGRVFFAQFHLDTLQSWLATAKSVVGIVIEGVFVAMIIQRLFR